MASIVMDIDNTLCDWYAVWEQLMAASMMEVRVVNRTTFDLGTRYGLSDAQVRYLWASDKLPALLRSAPRTGIRLPADFDIVTARGTSGGRNALATRRATNAWCRDNFGKEPTYVSTEARPAWIAEHGYAVAYDDNPDTLRELVKRGITARAIAYGYNRGIAGVDYVRG